MFDRRFRRRNDGRGKFSGRRRFLRLRGLSLEDGLRPRRQLGRDNAFALRADLDSRLCRIRLGGSRHASIRGRVSAACRIGRGYSFMIRTGRNGRLRRTCRWSGGSLLRTLVRLGRHAKTLGCSLRRERSKKDIANGRYWIRTASRQTFYSIATMHRGKVGNSRFMESVNPRGARQSAPLRCPGVPACRATPPAAASRA